MNSLVFADDLRRRGGWTAHLIGVVLGLVVVFLFAGHAALSARLRTIVTREAVTWPMLVDLGLLALLGMVVFAVVVAGRRLPALPTTVALVLLYGAAASLPTWLAGRLPMLGSWQPRFFNVVGATEPRWSGSALALLAGVMAASSVWSWWGYARRSRRSG